MNEQLIKFIELCLSDGVITDKEREVIFRKSKELGVPEDECEIILDSMIFKNNDNKKDSNITDESIDKTSQNEIKVNNEKDLEQNTYEKQNHGKVTILKKSDYGRSIQSQEEIKLQNFIMDFYDKGKVGGKEKKIIYEKSKELSVLKETCDVILNTVSSIYDQEPQPIKKEYVDGVDKNGLFIIKDEGEGRKIEQFYKDGLKHGLGKFYDENGKLSTETNYVMGKKNGVVKEFDYNGELYSETTYKDDKKNGVEKIYSKGICIVETTYKDDKKTGVVKEFDYNGELESEILWKDDDIIEEKYSRKKEEDKKEKQSLIKKKDIEKEFLSSVVFPNIVNSKSKFYEILKNEQFEFQKKFKDGFLGYKLDITSGVNDYQNKQFFNLLKLEVFNKIFKKKFFYPKRLSNMKKILNKFSEYYLPSIHGDDFGNYTDKNGFLFNPVTGYLVFYIDDDNIFKYEFEKVKSLSSLPFYKGGLFTKPGIKLNESGYKDGLHIGIKSKYFKETEETYRNWVKFLFTLEEFKTDFSKLRNEKLLLKTNQLHEFLDDLDWKRELKKHVTEVKGILNSKKKEIELKEKEFNSNFIHDFIKIRNFVESNIDSYWSMNIRLCMDIKRKVNGNEFLTLGEIEKITESHNKFISLNSTIIFGLIEMIRSVIYNDRIRFYEIYEKFDKLRIFNSQYQNDVINSLSSINQNLFDLNSKIDNLTNTIEMMSDQILSSIDELKFEVSYLNDNISGQLQGISSKLDVNNLLNMVQTYQLYRINSNTKSLRS